MILKLKFADQTSDPFNKCYCTNITNIFLLHPFIFSQLTLIFYLAITHNFAEHTALLRILKRMYPQSLINTAVLCCRLSPPKYFLSNINCMNFMCLRGFSDIPYTDSQCYYVGPLKNHHIRRINFELLIIMLYNKYSFFISR